MSSQTIENEDEKVLLNPKTRLTKSNLDSRHPVAREFDFHQILSNEKTASRPKMTRFGRWRALQWLTPNPPGTQIWLNPSLRNVKIRQVLPTAPTQISRSEAEYSTLVDNWPSTIMGGLNRSNSSRQGMNLLIHSSSRSFSDNPFPAEMRDYRRHVGYTGSHRGERKVGHAIERCDCSSSAQPRRSSYPPVVIRFTFLPVRLLGTSLICVLFP